MLYQVLERMIRRGQTQGLREKLDLFYEADRLTEGERQALCALLEVEG